ncbi:hypothetical protein CEXT_778891 [Caerostris extrusa]|uniref:Uncharacterized protein n=1 Tax=Caerostris extrusa TaxID=172846 RepID=A0AAV4S5L0_CAEEX|nr:hypothetical protein CEXT_778891 [Caerostris extrusa]
MTFTHFGITFLTFVVAGRVVPKESPSSATRSEPSAYHTVTGDSHHFLVTRTPDLPAPQFPQVIHENQRTPLVQLVTLSMTLGDLYTGTGCLFFACHSLTSDCPLSFFGVILRIRNVLWGRR